VNLRSVSALTREMALPMHWTGAYALIVTLALLIRIALLLFYGTEVVGDAVEYDRIALNLVQGHGYSLDLSAPFEWTTQREPLYPLFLASVYHWNGGVFGRL
jgi:hypothetical protein